MFRHPRIELADVAEPQPGPHDVVVEVARCGVCGSDTHVYESDSQGYVLFSGPARLPVIVGHEYAGRVVAIGSEVRHAQVGALVAAEGMLYCGGCEACRRGYPNQCPSLQMTGFSADGAAAQFIAVHERHVWSLDGLAEKLGSEVQALEMGALVEPISCPYNGIWGAGAPMAPGSHVAVYGCGPIGLGAILLCRAAGAGTITAFDVVPERVELARSCGADHAEQIGQGAAPSDVVRERTRGWGADLQIEAAGAAASTMPEIERAVAPGGVTVYLGRTGGCAPVGLDTLVSNAARIIGSRGHAGHGCFPNIIRMMESGALDPRPMITARKTLAESLDALERSTRRTDGKILLTL